MLHKVISADSHIVEPPHCYIDYIEPKYRATAPRIEETKSGAEVFVVDGMQTKIPLGLMAAAGINSKKLIPETKTAKFADLHKSGWDPAYRIADQEIDGVDAEIIYASVGMLICNHPDYDYKDACFMAYNRWLQEFCAPHPKRLFGLGQTAISSVEQGIKDFHKIKEMGFVGIMMPGNPQDEDYDSPIYDPLWECAIALDMPVCFHILTSRENTQHLAKFRGNKLNGFMSLIRGIQDMIGLFVLGGVFERHPKLKFVGAEGDAGWLPHFAHRMNHAVDRHGWGKDGRLVPRNPSEYIHDNVWLTFQDDWEAFYAKDRMNIERLLWANDFPHSDSSWPDSVEMLAKHTAHITEEERNLILGDNCAKLYNLDLD